MNREERERMVDGVLDRALGPQAVEPRPGLEERILANLPAAPAHPWWQWIWIPALAAAAVLAIVIGTRVMQKETPAPVQTKNSVESPKREVAVNPEAPVRQAIAPRRQITRHATQSVNTLPAPVVAQVEPPLPRQSVFPAPVPATPEEQALLAMLQRRPAQVVVVAEDQAAEREKVQKYFETGKPPEVMPVPAQTMR